MNLKKIEQIIDYVDAAFWLMIGIVLLLIVSIFTRMYTFGLVDPQVDLLIDIFNVCSKILIFIIILKIYFSLQKKIKEKE